MCRPVWEEFVRLDAFEVQIDTSVDIRVVTDDGAVVGSKTTVGRALIENVLDYADGRLHTVQLPIMNTRSGELVGVLHVRLCAALNDDIIAANKDRNPTVLLTAPKTTRSTRAVGGGRALRRVGGQARARGSRRSALAVPIPKSERRRRPARGGAAGTTREAVGAPSVYKDARRCASERNGQGDQEGEGHANSRRRSARRLRDAWKSVTRGRGGGGTSGARVERARGGQRRTQTTRRVEGWDKRCVNLQSNSARHHRGESFGDGTNATGDRSRAAERARRGEVDGDPWLNPTRGSNAQLVSQPFPRFSARED